MSDTKSEGEKQIKCSYLVVLAKKKFKFEWLPSYLRTLLEPYDIRDVIVNFRGAAHEGKELSLGEPSTSLSPEVGEEIGKIFPDIKSENPIFESESLNPEAVPLVEVPIEQRYQFSRGLDAVLNGSAIDMHADAMAAVHSPHGLCLVIPRKTTAASSSEESEDSEAVPETLKNIIKSQYISDEDLKVLRKWTATYDYPVPTKEQNQWLVRHTNLTENQVLSYYCKELRRYLTQRGQV